jgi:hypothetical protein
MSTTSPTSSNPAQSRKSPEKFFSLTLKAKSSSPAQGFPLPAPLAFHKASAATFRCPSQVFNFKTIFQQEEKNGRGERILLLMYGYGRFSGPDLAVVHRKPTSSVAD